MFFSESIHVKDKSVHNSAFDVSVQAGTVPRLWDTFITRNARHSRNGSRKPGWGTRYRLMVPKIKLNWRFIVSALFLLPSPCLRLFHSLASIFKSLVIYFFCWWRFEQFISVFNWFRMCSGINFMSSTLIACRASWGCWVEHKIDSKKQLRRDAVDR